MKGNKRDKKYNFLARQARSAWKLPG